MFSSYGTYGFIFLNLLIFAFPIYLEINIQSLICNGQTKALNPQCENCLSFKTDISFSGKVRFSFLKLSVNPVNSLVIAWLISLFIQKLSIT